MKYLGEKDKEKALVSLEKTFELMEQNHKTGEVLGKYTMSDVYRDYAIRLEERGQFERAEYYYNRPLSKLMNSIPSYRFRRLS